MPIRRSPILSLALVLAMAAAGCAARARRHEMHEMHRMHHPPGYTSDVTTVQVVSALVGGKNVYIPSTIVVTDGGPRTLSLLNTTEMPHGFAIAALGIETVLPPGEEVAVQLPPLQGGQVLRIHCHMHPPHRSATLVVLPSK